MQSPVRPRHLYPMPVHDLFAHPAYVALPAAGRGMLLSLCEHFWRSACAPLPRDDDQLFAIARAHRPTWRAHKATILKVFADIRPGLEAYFRKRQGNTCGLINAAHSANARRRAEALAKFHPVSPIHDMISQAIPRKEPQPLNPRPQPPGDRPKRYMMTLTNHDWAAMTFSASAETPGLNVGSITGSTISTLIRTGGVTHAADLRALALASCSSDTLDVVLG